MPIAGIALIPVFMGWPLILMPVHVTFMELILDDLAGVATATVCALAWMELMKQAWKTAG